MASSPFAFLNRLWFRGDNVTPPAEEPKSPDGPVQPSTRSLNPTCKSPLSPRLAYTFDLLSHTLPLLGELVGQLRRGFHRRDPRYEFSVRIKTAAYVLEKLVAGLRESHDAPAFEAAVEELADCLEKLCVANGVNASEFEKQQRWPVQRPRLSAIRRAANDPLMFPLIHQHLYDDLASLSTTAWRDFSQTLAVLTSQLQKGGLDSGDDQALPAPKSSDSSRPDWDFKDFVSDAFTAMACICHKQPGREIRFRLGTYKKPNGSGAVSHVTVLARDRPVEEWTEMRLHTTGNEAGSRILKVKISVPNDAPLNPSVRVEKFPVKRGECVCHCLRRHCNIRPSFWRLNLELENRYFARFWQDRRALAPASLHYQVSLKTLLSPQGAELSSLAGMSLSVMLAYSLFYLFGQPWAKDRWNRDNIVFFADDDLIPLRPFLQVSQKPPAHGSPDEQAYYRYPEFLELGVMLLEIYFRKSLEAILNLDPEIKTIDECFVAASEVYHSRKLDISQPGLRQAIQSCLSLAVGAGFCGEGNEEPDNETLRSSLFETVVQPLERDLEGAFEGLISTKSLDEEASKKIFLPFPIPKLDITDWSRSGQPKAATLLVRHDCRPRTREPSPNLTSRLIHPRPSPSPARPQKFTLFNIDAKAADPSPAGCHLTDDWIERFQTIVDEHPSSTGERLKVAVLDTGIDIDHPDFNGENRLRNCRSWVNSAAGVDKSGHGTHIVSTILRLTTNVDVYVAKIAEGNTLTTADHISEAVQVASEEWDVDIISLSFGFSRGFRKLRKEIDQAIYRKKIIFAAASNDGGNTARAYPASQDGVICVHSADGLSNASSFNPTALNKADNFCVVGENIKAAWASLTPNEPGGTRRMSGTSFATPVAVAIAAFMIGFVSSNVPEHTDWDIPLKSFAGVRAIFETLSERRTGKYDVVNPVRAFSGDTETEQDKILTEIRAKLDA